MLTRCPTCSTTFRVTPEQLKARQGRVRCGACQSVFNALDTLVEAPVVVPTPVPTPTAAPAPMAEPAVEEPVEAPAEPAVEEPDESADVAVATAAESPASEAGPAEFDRVEPVLASAEEAPPPAAAAEPPEPEEAEFVPDLEPLPPEATARRWPWALGLVGAVTVLIVQAALHFRTEIAVLYPEAKPLLVTACASLGCEVALPRRPDLVGIEASDLSPNDGGKLLLAATVKNRAPFAQEFPHLELTLTDTADRALVRRVIAPVDYLPQPTAAAAGISSNAELVVSLVVEAPGVNAAGYRLYLFYP